MDHGLPLSQAWARGRENYFIFYPFSCVIRIYLSICILSLENFASHKKIENRCQRQVLRLKMYLSCDCGRGSVPDPTGGAYSAPQTPSWAGFKGSASQQMRKSRVDRAEGTTLFYQPLHLASHLKVVFWWLILFITDANKRALWLWLWGKRRKGRRWMETYGKEWRGKGWCRLCTSLQELLRAPMNISQRMNAIAMKSFVLRFIFVQCQTNGMIDWRRSRTTHDFKRVNDNRCNERFACVQCGCSVGRDSTAIRIVRFYRAPINTLTCDIDIALMSVCLSVTLRHSIEMTKIMSQFLHHTIAQLF